MKELTQILGIFPKAPPPKPQRELDPFNPDWPKTRPMPAPKAQGPR